MEQHKVIGIGEILWDLFPDGEELGGAPTNFAWHIHNLGCRSTVISAVGNDELGNEIKNALKKKKLDHELNISSNPTGTVSVELQDGIPSYDIIEQVAWDDIELTDEMQAKLKVVDAICFGSLAQRSTKSRQTIHTALNLTPDNSLKIFDINLRQSYYSRELIDESLKQANVLKLNTEELAILRDYFNLELDREKACSKLIELYGLQLVALTNGGINSMLITGNDISVVPTPVIEVVDTVGAGDSFTASMVFGILEGESLEEIHQNAVNYSAYVCMHAGATPHIIL